MEEEAEGRTAEEAAMAEACAAVGVPMKDGETFEQWFWRVKTPRLGNGGDYGILPQPTTDRQALDWIAYKALGPDWRVNDPISREQANTCMAVDVANRLCMRGRCPFRKPPGLGPDDMQR